MTNVWGEIAQEIIDHAKEMFRQEYSEDYRMATVEFTRRLLLEEIDPEIGTVIAENLLGGI